MIQLENIAFESPGGECNEVSSRRPVDLCHLNQQTLGDRDLEQEILQMFFHQSAEMAEVLAKAEGLERKKAAHKLKGAARAIGAYDVADAAAAIEADPKSAAALRKLAAKIGDARDYISSICR